LTKKEDKEEQLDIENVAEDLEPANGIDSEEKNSSKITEKDEQKPEDKIKELEDQLLRAKAEVQNVRRIAAQEVTRARLYGIESLAKEFLAVGDNIERAITSCEGEEDTSNIKEGLELTLKAYESSLKASGIEPIDCVDQSFDPEKHEALSVIEDDDLEPNSIIEEIQKGYSILDRTLRPSKVIVSKKSEEK
jgi:Molecular chaperone GrpE (heat shock protein)